MKELLDTSSDMAVDNMDEIMDEIEVLTEDTLDKYEKHVNPGIARLMRYFGTSVEATTEGVYMTDIRGRKYLDFLGGHGVYNLGFRHPKVVAAVEEQLHKAPMAASWIFMNRQRAILSEKLARITPGDLYSAFICHSGTEAVEASIKIARAKTGKPGIIAAERAFHGKSMGSLSATARAAFRDPFKPLVPMISHVPFGNIDALKAVINEDTAAVILEPIQGEGGVIVPPDGYLADVRQLCNDTGVLLILDEVQTGMGRTGKMFACEHEGVTPDIMALAKALGGGIMPIGAMVATQEVFEPFEDPLIHTSSCGGNPLACAAANATIDVLIEEDLPRKAAENGDYLMGKLKTLQAKYPNVVKEVRGKGLMVGVEFADEGLAGSMIYAFEAAGILILHMFNNPSVIRLEPPLIITREHIDYMLNALEAAVEQHKELY